MNRMNDERDSDLIDLGSATAETKGPPAIPEDDQFGNLGGNGLADD